MGSGFTLISLPAFNNINGQPAELFRLKLNRTLETLTFSPIGGQVPNRGAAVFSDPKNPAPTSVTGGNNDTNLTGLTYVQKVTDARSNSALHIETGFWLNVPPSGTQPAWTIARLSTIPHGDSVLATGAAITASAPVISASVPSTDPTILNPSTPTFSGTITPIPAKLMGPFNGVQTPTSDYLPAFVQQPNQALLSANVNTSFVNTVVLFVSSADMSRVFPVPGGAFPVTNPAPAGLDDPNISQVAKPLTSFTVPAAASTGSAALTGAISNIPFVQLNANASRLDAIFWIETISDTDERGKPVTIQQLQYTQTVMLQFNGIDWPHISVATLVKQ